MIQEPPNRTWIVLIVAIISATAVICGAIIGLGKPFSERLADRYYPPFTPTVHSIFSTTVLLPSQEPTHPPSTPIPVPVITSTPISTATSQSSSNDQYDGWVICWHGRDGYEYLIAYPESDAKQGINLNFNLINAQGRQVEIANDSLKMCYVSGEWYGYPDPNPWFPTVSYLQLLDKQILVCSDSPGCQGHQWTMLPQKYFPWNAPALQPPTGTGIQIIAYKSSQ